MEPGVGVGPARLVPLTEEEPAPEAMRSLPAARRRSICRSICPSICRSICPSICLRSDGGGGSRRGHRRPVLLRLRPLPTTLPPRRPHQRRRIRPGLPPAPGLHGLPGQQGDLGLQPGHPPAPASGIAGVAEQRAQLGRHGGTLGPELLQLGSGSGSGSGSGGRRMRRRHFAPRKSNERSNERMPRWTDRGDGPFRSSRFTRRQKYADGHINYTREYQYVTQNRHDMGFGGRRVSIPRFLVNY